MTFIFNIPLKFNISPTSFRNKQTQSVSQIPFANNFVSNPLSDSFGAINSYEVIFEENPKIKSILKQNNLPYKINLVELEKLKKGHLRDTRIVAAQIYSSLPQELKSEVNLKNLQEAAMYHDYGKVLIPNSILNKTGKLTSDENEIMKLHAELSYELLKNKGLNKETLNIIKYHHQNLKQTGYPKIEDDFEYGLSSQILNVADKYSALCERRSYKEPMSKENALKIIYEDVKSGLISQEVYNALEKAV